MLERVLDLGSLVIYVGILCGGALWAFGACFGTVAERIRDRDDARDVDRALWKRALIFLPLYAGLVVMAYRYSPWSGR